MNEVLLRQVHPVHLKSDGTLSAQAFGPTKRDGGMLSTLRESVGPQEAHRRWVEDLAHESLGTWGVSVGEVEAVRILHPAAAGPLGLRALDDAVSCGVPDHASIDFNELGTPGQVKQASRKLLRFAAQRGTLYP